MNKNANRIVPLKKFGQNYLKDKNTLRKIAEQINPQENDTLIEIGPGTGALTEMLYEKTHDFTAVEIDKRVIDELTNIYPQLNILQGDFLKFDLKEHFRKRNSKIRIVGNIPYNITSPILFKLLHNRMYVSDSVLMMQYEVAKRLSGKMGTKDYGILSIIMNTFADVFFCFKVSANVFYPKPKVDSAVVHLSYKEHITDIEDEKLFIDVVKACFGNRRKTLKNSLSNSIFKNIDFQDAPVDTTLRAERLTINDFKHLTNFIKQKK